jgi:hypothetical protein
MIDRQSGGRLVGGDEGSGGFGARVVDIEAQRQGLRRVRPYQQASADGPAGVEVIAGLSGGHTDARVEEPLHRPVSRILVNLRH